VSIITLKSPFSSYRGTTSFPHPDGQVVYPIGNRTFSRAYVHPDNPDTPLQSILRAHLTAISQAWQTVSNVNAAGWATLGLAMSPVTDPDGLDYNLVAQNAYTSINMYRLLDGEAQTAVAPAFSLAAAPGIDTVTLGTLPPDIRINFSAPIAQSGFVLLEVSPQTYSARREARFNEVVMPDEDTAKMIYPVVSGWTNVNVMTDTFRFTVEVDDRRGIRLTYLDTNYVPGQTDFVTVTLGAT